MDKLKEDKQISRAVARFFADGGALQCRKREPCIEESGGILPQKIFELCLAQEVQGGEGGGGAAAPLLPRYDFSYGFWKLVTLSVFQSSFLLFVRFYI